VIVRQYWQEACGVPDGAPHALLFCERKSMARRYGKKASRKVERAMHEMKRGELKSGRSGKKVTSRKQAIAIGLSEARKEGAKAPPRRSTSSRAGTKRRSSRSSSK
jgi:hypothetical protein